MWGEAARFARQLLCPTMLFPLLCWAAICLLLPSVGCQLEEPAMDLKETVKSDSIVTAALGGEANLYCNFSHSKDVLQVTWQKINASSSQNIATYSPDHGPRLIGSFQKKARFTTATLEASAITLQDLTFKDESYYRCIFNVFRHGSFSKDIHLNIQSISDLTVEYDSHLSTKGVLTAVCSATGKPAPQITWLDDRDVDDRDLDESSEIQYTENANGTVTVANRRNFSANHHRVLSCLLDHPQGRKIKTVDLEKGRKGFQKSFIITAVIIAVVFFPTLTYCVMRLVNRKTKTQKRPSALRTPAGGERLTPRPHRESREPAHIEGPGLTHIEGCCLSK